jgi:hypothetical protein
MSAIGKSDIGAATVRLFIRLDVFDGLHDPKDVDDIVEYIKTYK